MKNIVIDHLVWDGGRWPVNEIPDRHLGEMIEYIALAYPDDWRTRPACYTAKMEYDRRRMRKAWAYEEGKGSG